ILHPECELDSEHRVTDAGNVGAGYRRGAHSRPAGCEPYEIVRLDDDQSPRRVWRQIRDTSDHRESRAQRLGGRVGPFGFPELDVALSGAWVGPSCEVDVGARKRGRHRLPGPLMSESGV